MKGLKKIIRDNRYLNWLLILSNWVFQSIPHADGTEKLYKISFTLLFWVCFYFLFEYFSNFSQFANLIIGFIVAHSLNWIVNGNFYNLLIHRLMFAKLNKKDLFEYIELLEQKMKGQDWALYAASFGSVCRGELKDSSDIDISIVRKPGFRNGILSIWFSLKEKKIADMKGIPLEIYISDSPADSINRFGAEKNPVIIYDPENTIDKLYQEKLTIYEARILNKTLE